MPKDIRLEFPDSMLQLRRTSDTHVSYEGMPTEFEFILNDIDDGDWIYGPDPGIRRPLESVYAASPLGVPVTRPEILLLYKARSHRPKDDYDFEVLRDCLTEDQRAWLRTHLERLQPNDPWLPRLR
jgi:hypothetical protein